MEYTHPQASRDTRHDNGDEMVEVAICWGGKLESTEADFIQGFVINAEGLVRVFNELMHGERRVIWFYDGIGDLMRVSGGARTKVR